MGNENSVHLGELKRDFATLRRPYVTLANAIKIIEEQCKLETDDEVKVGIDPKRHSVAPFDFVVYSRLPDPPDAVKALDDKNDHKEVFRLLPGYDEGKFHKILSNRNIFTDTFGDPKKQLPPNTLSRYLDGFYRDVIKHFHTLPSQSDGKSSEQNDLEFITAVYHLIYTASNPVYTHAGKKQSTGNFVGGLFQSEKLMKLIDLRIEDIPFEGKLAEKNAGLLEPLEIDGNIYEQISEDFELGHFGTYKTYYENWLSVVQGFEYSGFPEILYYPIFDGLSAAKGVLTGYLGIYCTTPEVKQKIKDYITESRLSIIQNSINAANNKGTHNAILDSYKSLDDYPDPVTFWIENLQLLHNWESINTSEKKLNKQRLWWTNTEENVCCLDIGRALALYESIADTNNNVNGNSFHSSHGIILELQFPEHPILNATDIDDDSPYLQRRMGEILGLLNDIMVRWQVLKNEQQAIDHTRKTVISQIIARNYAHNIGSHVKNRTHIDDIKYRIQDLYNINLNTNEFAVQNKSKLHSSHLHKDTFDKIRQLKQSINLHYNITLLTDDNENIQISFLDFQYITSYVSFLKKKLDQYEIQRNEYTADFRMPLKNVRFYENIILPFVTNTLILDNLAASEGVRYSDHNKTNRVTIDFYFNGHCLKAFFPDVTSFRTESEVVYPDNYPYLIVPKSYDIEKKDIESCLNNIQICSNDAETAIDPEVMVPSEHALYSILENFIRNSSKHNKNYLKDNQLVIIIDLRDSGSSHYDLFLYDNVSCMKEDDLYNFIQRKNKPLIVDGSPQNENFGIADMKINAHLLQSSEEFTEDQLNDALDIIFYCNDEIKGKHKFLSTENIETPENLREMIRKDDIKPRNHDHSSDDTKSHYAFGYKLKIRKSKKVCWIGAKFSLRKKVTYSLQNKGICFFDNISSFKNENDNNTNAAWQFAILEPEAVSDWKLTETEEIPEEIENILNNLPFRLLYNGLEPEKNECIQELIHRRRIQPVTEKIHMPSIQNEHELEDSTFCILEECWINWLKRWTKNRPVHLLLSFEDINTAWRAHFDDFSKSDTDTAILHDNVYFHLNLSFGGAKIDNNPDEHWIIFDQHGQGAQQLQYTPCLERTFYQSIGKNSSDFSHLMYPPGPGETRKAKLLSYELIESGLLNIMVLDERLCEKMFSPFSGHADSLFAPTKFEQKRWLYGVWSKIWFANYLETTPIVKNDSDLFLGLHNYCPSFQFNRRIPVSAVMKHLKKFEISNNIDIVLIHRTFLSDNNLGIGSKKYISKLKKTIPYIIVTSGGGKPHGLEGYYRFKPLSQLTDFFTSELFSKFSINKIITS